MKKYTSISDLEHLGKAIQEAISLKKEPLKHYNIGKNKTIILLFFNASLRTRLSTEKAAKNLGMDVIVLQIKDAWSLAFDDGSVMNLEAAEHIKEAAKVISQYGDIIGIRAFPSLTNKIDDEAENILNGFLKHATVPVVSLESATEHPLQALADAITITENKTCSKPKVVLTWAPHPKALPHAVANSFVGIMQKLDATFLITHPKGYELDYRVTKNTPIVYNQDEALKDADFVYAKNWSSYTNYGTILSHDPEWMITKEKIGNAKFMHCLPVRRNVVVEDAVLDSNKSLIIEQANNRTFAAQLILKKILTSN